MDPNTVQPDPERSAPAGVHAAADAELGLARSLSPRLVEAEVEALAEEIRSKWIPKAGSMPPSSEKLRATIVEVDLEIQSKLARVESEVIPALSEVERRMLDRMTRLVIGSGGEIEDRIFVTRPGVMILTKEPELTPAAEALFGAMRIDTDQPGYQSLVHFKTAVTNLTFPEKGKDTASFLDNVVGKSGHRSVTNDIKPVFFIAGVGLETQLELIAHHEADVGRLTSSATVAANFPLFEVNGTTWERMLQKLRTLDHILYSRDFDQRFDPRSLSADGKELANREHPGNKAVALTYSMGLKDFHKLFIGRLAPHGNELGIQEVIGRMCGVLHTAFPLVINEPAWYPSQGNAKKYQ